MELDDRVHLTEEGFLEIEDAVESDTGHYGCHAKNSVGKSSFRVQITVYDPRLERESQRKILNGNISARLQQSSKKLQIVSRKL